MCSTTLQDIYNYVNPPPGLIHPLIQRLRMMVRGEEELPVHDDDDGDDDGDDDDETASMTDDENDEKEAEFIEEMEIEIYLN